MFELLMMLTFVVWRCLASLHCGAVPEPEKIGRLGDIHIIREQKNGVFHPSSLWVEEID